MRYRALQLCLNIQNTTEPHKGAFRGSIQGRPSRKSAGGVRQSFSHSVRSSRTQMWGKWKVGADVTASCIWFRGQYKFFNSSWASRCSLGLGRRGIFHNSAMLVGFFLLSVGSFASISVCLSQGVDRAFRVPSWIYFSKSIASSHFSVG